MVTAQDLQEAETEYVSSQVHNDEKREARRDLFRRALAEGWTLAQIGDEVGLTKGRIHQIVHESDRRSDEAL